MKSQIALLVFGATLALVCMIGATSSPGFKFGVVDMDQAIAATDEGKDARIRYMEKVREVEEELQKLFESYQKISEEIKTQQYVLSAEKLRAKLIERARIENEIVNERRKKEGELKIEQERLFGPLRIRLAKIVQELGRNGGFGLIVAEGTPGVMYTREAESITDAVIERLNRKS